MPKSAAPRIAVFTHDTYGLGHVRRCLHIVRAFAKRVPDATILFITGCPSLHVFADLPPNTDFVKIPTVVKTGGEGFKPPHLTIPLDEVSSMRSRMISEALAVFDPDVLLVDNFPLGSRRELSPVLDELRERRTRVVLGLRDIVDAPHKVRADWTRDDIYRSLHDHYDRVLVYGSASIFDVAEAYALPPELARKVHYCGYVTDTKPPLRTAAEVRADVGIEGPFVLATVGGGGDGFPLIEAFLAALRLLPEVAAVVVTGPLMSQLQQAETAALVEAGQDVVVRDFVPDLTSFMAAAELVVAMGGYNTTAEILALGKRAIIVPRTWRYGEHFDRQNAATEWEQILRAQALERAGLIELLPPEDLSGDTLAQRIGGMLASPRRGPQATIDLGGVEAVVDQLLDLVGEPKGEADVAR